MDRASIRENRAKSFKTLLNTALKPLKKVNEVIKGVLDASAIFYSGLNHSTNEHENFERFIQKGEIKISDNLD